MENFLLKNSLLDKISIDDFVNAYNSYPPNVWIKFAFRYFSKDTKDSDKWLTNLISGVLIVLFIIGFTGVAFNLGKIYVLSSIIPLGGIIVTLGLMIFGAKIMNNLRIRKICKKLDISIKEYEILVNYYKL